MEKVNDENAQEIPKKLEETREAELYQVLKHVIVTQEGKQFHRIDGCVYGMGRPKTDPNIHKYGKKQTKTILQVSACAHC